MKEIGRKALNILLMTAMVIGLLPGMGMTTYAEESESGETLDLYTEQTARSDKKPEPATFSQANVAAEGYAYDNAGWIIGYYCRDDYENCCLKFTAQNGKAIVRVVLEAGYTERGNLNSITADETPSINAETTAVTYENDKGVSSVTFGYNVSEDVTDNDTAEYVQIKRAAVYCIDANPVTDITLAPNTAQMIDVNGKVQFTAAIASSDAADKFMKWSVTGTNPEAVKLYADEACTIEVGTDAIETLTVYAKGVSAGSAAVTVTSVADETKTATCPVTVSAPVTAYAVTITPGSNMTKTADSGAETQTGVSGAMTPVIYKANTGYQFPAASEYYKETNGIKVTGSNPTEVTVSGTPTGVANVTIPDAIPSHTHNEITFEPWNRADSLPDSGNYYLTGNVTVNKSTIVSNTLNLCLNGYGILMTGNAGVFQVNSGAAMNLYDCKGSNETHYITLTGWRGTSVDATGSASDVTADGNGVIQVSSGYITGGNATEPGGGAFRVHGKFNMYGGTILGNCATKTGNKGGSGGAVWSEGAATIAGDSRIMYNKGTEGDRGGVYISGGTFNISGAPDLTGNSGRDVVLNGTDKHITFADNEFNPDVRIGVIYCAGNPKEWVITAGAQFTSNEQAQAVFTPPSANRTIIMSEGQAKLVTPVENVTLSPTATVITKNSAVKLTAAVKPDTATDRTVQWNVSGTNSDAVKLYCDEECTEEVGEDAVETLTVYAKGISSGIATVTATSNADETKNASCNVTVTVPVTGVTLNKTSTALTKNNGSETLVAAVAPEDATDKTVTWTSSNPDVATIDDKGRITGKAVGMTTITATATNGTEDTSDDNTATCTVTVIDTAGKWNVGADPNNHPVWAWHDENTLYISCVNGDTGAMKNFDQTNDQVPWNDLLQNVTGIVITEGVTTIGNFAFYLFGHLSSVTIPESVTSIGQSSFAGCYVLREVTIPSKVTSIGESAFESCRYIKSVSIPEGVKSIEDKTFKACLLLNTVTIPEGVTGIGEYAFQYCEKLSSVTIPSSVTTIGEHAFSECTALGTVTFTPVTYDPVKGAIFISFGEKCFGSNNNAAVAYDTKTGNTRLFKNYYGSVPKSV